MSKTLYLELNDRSKQIFKSVIEAYLTSGEPIGSKTLSNKLGFNISSSAIRSIMANLQIEGL